MFDSIILGPGEFGGINYSKKLKCIIIIIISVYFVLLVGTSAVGRYTVDVCPLLRVSVINDDFYSKPL